MTLLLYIGKIAKLGLQGKLLSDCTYGSISSSDAAYRTLTPEQPYSRDLFRVR
jgi:hypothetical protein